MKLSDYIREQGYEKFAKAFKIKPRAAKSYMYEERSPKKKLAQKIVDKSPVTWQGIYGE